MRVLRLSGERVTRDSLREEMQRAGLVHLACHGTFEADRPDRIGLVLVRDDGASEVLSLKDLAAADLSAVAHVTLSSCWSADQFVFPGHWIIGLPEVLWRRGVDTVLGSMWPVDDDAAVDVVSKFQRLSMTLSPEVALQQVQLGLIRRTALTGGSPQREARGPLDTTDLFHWAGFRVCGSGPGLPLRASLRQAEPRAALGR